MGGIMMTDEQGPISAILICHPILVNEKMWINYLTESTKFRSIIINNNNSRCGRIMERMNIRDPTSTID